MTILAQMLMYGKEARKRKQEIDRQHHTIPNQRNQGLKAKHYGNVHNRLWNPSHIHVIDCTCRLRKRTRKLIVLIFYI